MVEIWKIKTNSKTAFPPKDTPPRVIEVKLKSLRSLGRIQNFVEVRQILVGYLLYNDIIWRYVITEFFEHRQIMVRGDWLVVPSSDTVPFLQLWLSPLESTEGRREERAERDTIICPWKWPLSKFDSISYLWDGRTLFYGSGTFHLKEGSSLYCSTEVGVHACNISAGLVP